jgi:Tol biopolymer transport system component
MKAHLSQFKLSLLASLMAAIILTACGGGGGGSSPLVTGPDGSASDTTDVDYVVFLADADTSGQTELYAGDTDGNAPVRLNGDLQSDGDVKSFKISPDGTNVAYVADEDTDGIDELYVAVMDGSEAIKVSHDLGSEGDVISYKWSPDGSRLAYLARGDAMLGFHLYTVKADGSEPYRASGDLADFVSIFVLPIGGKVIDPWYQWSPDGEYLAYVAVRGGSIADSGPLDDRLLIEEIDGVGDGGDRLILPGPTDDGTMQLFAVRYDGSALAAISLNILESERTIWFQWHPDNMRIAYRVTRTDIGETELMVADRDGSNRISLSGEYPSVVTALSIYFLEDVFAWSPDGLTMAYMAPDATTGAPEIYTVSPDGSGRAKVSRGMLADGQIIGFRWSADSRRLAYLAQRSAVLLFELYTVMSDGSSHVMVHPPLTGGRTIWYDVKWSPDGSRLAYLANQESVDRLELYSVNADGSSNTKLNGDLIGGGYVRGFQWSPDSDRLVYRADQESYTTIELYTVLPDGSDNRKLNETLTADADIRPFKWLWDGSAVVYRADEITDEVNELFCISVDGDDPAVNVSGTMTTGAEGVIGFDVY